MGKKYYENGVRKMNAVTKVFIGFLAVIAGLWMINKFFDNFRLKSPVLFQMPIERRFVPSVVPSLKPKPRQSAPERVESSQIKTMTIDETIADYIKSKDWDYSTAIRIAKSENFWNLNRQFDCKRRGGKNTNGTFDYGLWQINDLHIKSGAISLEDALDCFKSTDFAYKLYLGHKRSFESWSAYNNLSYLNHNEIIY